MTYTNESHAFEALSICDQTVRTNRHSQSYAINNISMNMTHISTIHVITYFVNIDINNID